MAETTPVTQTASSTEERPNERGRVCKDAELAISKRAESNDESLVRAIIQEPHSDVVCIPVSYLASLPELANFAPKMEATHREKYLISVLESSAHLKTMKDKEGKIIIRTEFKRSPQNTLIMHNIPVDAKENDLRELFLSVPTAASVSFKKDINSCWTATFDTEANAIATHRVLVVQRLTVKGCPISIGVRTTRFQRVTPPPTTTPAQPAAAPATTQPNPYNGMRVAPQSMRYAVPPQYWMPQMQPFLYNNSYFVPAQRTGGQHPAWIAQQKPRNTRGPHPRYQNPAVPPQQQQQPRVPEQNLAAASRPAPAVPAAAPAAAAAPAPAAAAAAAATTAPAPAQQQQQPARESGRQGGRSNRGYRNRNRGGANNRGHGGASGGGASSEASATEGNASEQHPKHQRQSAAAERQEQPAKTQKKPSADSFPPLE